MYGRREIGKQTFLVHGFYEISFVTTVGKTEGNLFKLFEKTIYAIYRERFLKGILFLSQHDN